jgi:MbtH protein
MGPQQSASSKLAYLSGIVPEPGYLVVVNEEDQYSIWEETMTLPSGWRREKFRGPREKCLSYIEQIWTDMRPRSLRSASQRADR